MKFEDNGIDAWQTNAEFWDTQMGDESNFFHCDIVRPKVLELLNINQNDVIVDIACGNGNFSETIAKKGARVIAFDYSGNMIELAKKRRENILDLVSFNVCDATNYDEIINVCRGVDVNKAVSNMAIMDISDIEPLFKAMYDTLPINGIFVFATHHPCFTYENDDYFTPALNKGVAIEGQPVYQNYYHRSIAEILNIAFKFGFLLDEFYEFPFPKENVPIIMTIRLRKM